MNPYAANLGGTLDDGRMGEGHRVGLVVAADRTEAMPKANAKRRGAPPDYTDALEVIGRVDSVDGCASSPTGRLEGDDEVEMEMVN